MKEVPVWLTALVVVAVAGLFRIDLLPIYRAALGVNHLNLNNERPRPSMIKRVAIRVSPPQECLQELCRVNGLSVDAPWLAAQR